MHTTNRKFVRKASLPLRHCSHVRFYFTDRYSPSYRILVSIDVIVGHQRWHRISFFGWPIGPWEIWMKFRHVIFKQILVIDGWGISCEIALMWMSLDFTEDQSTLVQVMAWCRQATSHYLSQNWPRSLLPYGVAMPQSVNSDCFSILVSWDYRFLPTHFPKYVKTTEVKLPAYILQNRQWSHQSCFCYTFDICYILPKCSLK